MVWEPADLCKSPLALKMAKLLSSENLRMKGLPTLKGKGSRLGFRVWFIPVAIVLFGSVAWWTRSSLETTLKGRVADGL